MKKPSYALLLVMGLACLFTGCDNKKELGLTSSEESPSISGARGPTLRAGLVPKDELQRIFGVQALGFPLAKENVPKAQHYEMIQLILDVPVSQALAINNRGQIVGWDKHLGQRKFYAFLWENGNWHNLGVFDGVSSFGQDINDLGEVLVSVTRPIPQSDLEEGYSLIWKDGTVRAIISNTPGTRVVATSINNKSQVVGYISTPENHTTAFFWERGVMTSIGTPGGQGGSLAWSINERGQVAGVMYDGGGESAFLWEKGVLTRIEALEGTYSNNERGEIAGWNGLTALVWWKGKIQELGPSIALSINNRGAVVGQMYVSTGARGIIWERGTPAELPSLGGEWDAPADINERGQIVGRSNNRAVLWQPTGHASAERLRVPTARE